MESTEPDVFITRVMPNQQPKNRVTYDYRSLTEPTCLELEEIGQLYRTTACDEDYINRIADWILNWQSITSCATKLDTGLENWQQRLHEVSTKICARIDHAIRWVGTEIREPPSFNGINDIETLLAQYEYDVSEN